jgi:hypothetical protein
MVETSHNLTKARSSKRPSAHLATFQALPDPVKCKVRILVMNHPDWNISYNTFDNYLKRNGSDAFDIRLRLEMDRYLNPTA